MKATETQKTRLHHWLHSGREITPLQALAMWGCFRLGARIKELRNEGVTIARRFVTNSHGVRFAAYRLHTVQLDQAPMTTDQEPSL